MEVAVEFPVVLYNGERQINIGNIEIHPTIDFPKFRTMLKQMVGISYNNLTTYLVESRRSEIQPDRRKILITSKVDFLVLVRETNAYFLVVLKRSRRDRRRKSNGRNCVALSPADLFDYRFDNYEKTAMIVPESGKVELWLHELQMRRRNNVNMMIRNLNDGDLCSHVNGNFPTITEVYPVVERTVSRELCEDCAQANAQGVKPSFHLCVYDEVVEGFFRSPAGPISRPRRPVSTVF